MISLGKKEECTFALCSLGELSIALCRNASKIKQKVAI